MSDFIHRPNKVLQLFTVQQFKMGKLIRTFTMHTDFPMPVPVIGERISYGPSNNEGGDGNAIIGDVASIQNSSEVLDDNTLRFSLVIDVNS